MISINNYISNLQQSILSYIGSQKLEPKASVTSAFNKFKSSIVDPVVHMRFNKVAITPLEISNDPSFNKNKIDINLSFSIYVPFKLGADICHSIFYQLSNMLINNNIGIPFLSISCDNIEFLKSINCFLLTVCAPISIVPS